MSSDSGSTAAAESSSSGSSSGPGSSGPADATGIGTGSASGDGTDGTGTTAAATGGTDDSGSGSGSGDTTEGMVSDVGCADGEREALDDLAAYPNIAACSGGFSVPGVGTDMPTCDRSGGDDGLVPDGLSCRIDDLCAAGWHVCTSQGEVAAMGIGDCDAIAWNDGFYATAQSGEGFDSCAPTGTNDVFGCGDVGYTDIGGCSPLNRSTSDECGMIEGPWSCPDRYDELNTLVKTGPEFGGALCCRDGA